MFIALLSRISKVKRLLVVSALFILLAFKGSDHVSDDAFEISKNIDILGRILNEINQNYVDDIEPNQFMKVGIDAMLKSLDPYTNYISASEIEDYRFQSTGQYGGIGATLTKQDDNIVIADVYKDKPAHKAGLKPGDIILQVDEEKIEGKNFDQQDVRNLVRGQPNTSIRLVIRRYGVQNPLTFNVIRQDIKVNNVEYYGLLKNDIGYVHLTHFTQDATAEVKKAIEALKAQNSNLKGIILDLRDNPGGLLMEAIGISNLFVNQGEKIVETRGKMDGSYKRYDAQHAPLDTKLPVAVLVNGASASASEIVSGVMQDLDRGVVVGRRSFGKGLVQTTRQLRFNTQLKLTTARYYTPSGRCIQAIDYSHKKKDGSVVRTANSQKTQFKTRAGRPVWDAGGVDPDVLVQPVEYHKIATELKSKHFIDRFATVFYYKQDSIPPPGKFEVTDALYEEFVNFVKTNNFKPESGYAKELEALRKNLEKEKYYNSIKPNFDALTTAIETHRAQDIYTHKPQIKRLLETEIISRYYFEAGRIQASLFDDPDVNEAIAVLLNPDRYKGLLNGSIRENKVDYSKDTAEDSESDSNQQNSKRGRKPKN